MDGFKTIEIHRPQYPQVLRWVDAEFRVIYINMDAAPDASLICLLADDEGEED